MPEGLEAEIWREAIGALVGRGITRCEVDRRVTEDGLVDLVVGASIESVSRRGKVVLLHLDTPGVVGLHFGMTGRVVVDGRSPIERLAYASGADRPEWDRLQLWTQPSPAGAMPALRMNDPRRLGHVSWNPDLDALGPEASALTAAELRLALAGRTASIKPLLLDQHVVAGLGNLCADEVLHASGIEPHRSADSLTPTETVALARACRTRLAAMLRRGGSTSGRLDPERRAGPGNCPLDGAPLRRASIAGRTAVWCPQHQQ